MSERESSIPGGSTDDLRQAVRLLRRQPGSVAASMLTIALGVAAVTTLVSVVYGVLLKPLPWPQSDRLVVVTETRGGKNARWGPTLTNATYLAWREQATTVDDIAAWSALSVTASGAGDPERIRVVRSTASLARVLAARPAHGRLLIESDEIAQPQVVVLAHGWWLRRLGGSPDAIGRTLEIDGRPHTIVGVLPPGFALPDRTAQAWVPYLVRPAAGNNLSMFSGLARLRPGVSAAQAAAEGTARGRFVPDSGLTTVAVFGSSGPVEVQTVGLIETLTSEIRPALQVFLAAVVLLFVTALTNVVSLQLARSTARRREIAIRAALGAGRARLSRQLMLESLLLGLAGGAGGLAISAILHRALPSLLPADFPRLADITLSAGLAAFALAVSMLSGMVVALLPLLEARRLNLVENLAEDGGAPIGGGSRTRTARVRLLIIGGQVAVACILLVGASLLGRSFVLLLNADRGFDPAHALTARAHVPRTRFTPERRAEVLNVVLERLRAMPRVSSAAFTTHLPLAGDGLSSYGFRMPSRRGEGTLVDVQTAYHVVSPDYFAAMNMRVTGRPFTSRDTRTSQPVVVVNRAFARAYLDDTPLGERLPIRMRQEGKAESEVVGVVDDVRQPAAAEPAKPELYVPAAQTSLTGDSVSIVVRTHDDPAAFVGTLKAVFQEADRSVALDSVATMAERIRMSLLRPRLYAVILGVFASFALAITGVGLFGVLSHSVALRRREIGVRTALGATRGRILKTVIGQTAAVTLAGIGVGLSGGYVLTRSMAGLVFGISTDDPLSFAAGPVLVLVVALVACGVPARRAAAINPMDALRQN